MEEHWVAEVGALTSVAWKGASQPDTEAVAEVANKVEGQPFQLAVVVALQMREPPVEAGVACLGEVAGTAEGAVVAAWNVVGFLDQVAAADPAKMVAQALAWVGRHRLVWVVGVVQVVLEEV